MQEGGGGDGAATLRWKLEGRRLGGGLSERGQRLGASIGRGSTAGHGAKDIQRTLHSTRVFRDNGTL